MIDLPFVGSGLKKELGERTIELTYCDGSTECFEIDLLAFTSGGNFIIRLQESGSEIWFSQHNVRKFVDNLNSEEGSR